ncbi:MAG: hypothetical protein VW057_08810 [Rhodospirillaceae bacterium]
MILLSGSKASALKFDHLDYYYTDHAKWGQIAGCVLRFDYYRELSLAKSAKGNLLPAEVINQLINYELGNTNDAYIFLYDMGYAIGFLRDDGITGQQWEKSILDTIEKEFDQGVAWIQTVSCMKILIKNKIL